VRYLGYPEHDVKLLTLFWKCAGKLHSSALVNCTVVRCMCACYPEQDVKLLTLFWKYVGTLHCRHGRVLSLSVIEPHGLGSAAKGLILSNVLPK
jgi:hypothetical protein